MTISRHQLLIYLWYHMLTESWHEMLTFNGISTLEILKRNSLGFSILAGKSLAKKERLQIRMTASLQKN